MVRPLCALALSIPFAVLAPCALAQVQVDATASNLRYTLADLDPTDAQAPELRLGGTAGTQFLQGSLHAFHGQADAVDDYRVNLVRDDAGATSLENSWNGIGTVLAGFDPGARVQDWESSASVHVHRVLN